MRCNPLYELQFDCKMTCGVVNGDIACSASAEGLTWDCLCLIQRKTTGMTHTVPQAVFVGFKLNVLLGLKPR